ncbi:Crp/Fnr family transcriptional regulator [Aurantiacibacter spongiae]|uniref:Crp/Fnr family transcriptional regulator n=1 Tax=Aurantiacibacter spongiae TaxID=2488860 RepID=A0A3N5DT72_9SPHN|nr:Crp/Fnr family transcriptional regulator [Aurantiacibacter spongiae]RPF72531.1 Crp/Fnr family transcriptional regulator [Aurantiacibacter spongiae]
MAGDFANGRRVAPTGSVDKFVKAVRKRFAFSDAEERMLLERMSGTTRFSAGDVLVSEGSPVTFSSLLSDGFVCREKMTDSGHRQIAEVTVPGDFIDLHSYPLGRLDHSITALTDCRTVRLYHEDIDAIIQERPRLARILWFATMVDASIHREWIVNLGSRKGAKRMAHFFCEMYYRLEVVDMVRDGTFFLPLTQGQLGEALGFTPVHTNRLLQELRAANLLEYRSHSATVADIGELASFAGFDPDYLYLGGARHRAGLDRADHQYGASTR